MKMKFWLYGGLLTLVATNANAVTMLIGDVDGFGFTNPNIYENAQGGDPDTDGDGLIEPGEFLPDLDGDGKVHVTRSDEFDNRSASEASSTIGAQWTDVSLEDFYTDPSDQDPNFGDSPGDDAEFTFVFGVPVLGDSDFGVDHYINFVFGDYDVIPASINVDGVTVGLTTQSGTEDGLVQLAYADVAWASMTDGEVVISLFAPNEPYLAIDYAYLHTENEAAPPAVPLPAAVWLFGSALMGVAGVGYRRKKKEA